MLFLDLETTGLNCRSDKIRLVQLRQDNEEIQVIDLWKEKFDIIAAIEGNDICGHNLKFDMGFLRVLKGSKLELGQLFDTMIADQVIYGGLFEFVAGKQQPYKHNLALVANRMLGVRMDKSHQKSDWTQALTPAQLDYAATDVRHLKEIMEIQSTLLAKNGLNTTFKLEMEALPALVEMEISGMPFNEGAAETLRREMVLEQNRIEYALKSEAAKVMKTGQRNLFGDVVCDINLNSPKQILDLLHQKGYKLSSSAKEVIQELNDPWVDSFLEYRKIKRLITFMDSWLADFYDPKAQRIYPQYWQCSTTTGRMSSSDPNIQQVPKRGRGQVLRSLFRANPGNKIVKCDFSGIELRIMARLTMDPTMIDLFKKDADLHKYMAAKVANKEMEEVTKDERTNAKIINFGFIYGMGAPTFQDYARNLYRIHMPIEEAEKSRRVFFQTYPEIAKWHREQAHRLQGNAVETYNFYNHQRGYYTRYVYVTRTLLDRKRLFPLAMGKVVAKLPETLNMPDQGTGADLMKISLARAYRELPPDYKLIAAVHDEIVLEVPEARAMDAGLWIKKIMEEEGCKLLAPVPVTAEVSVADSW